MTRKEEGKTLYMGWVTYESEPLYEDIKGLYIGRAGFRDASLYEFTFSGDEVYDSIAKATVGKDKGKADIMIFYNSKMKGLGIIGYDGDPLIIHTWAFITGRDGDEPRNLTRAERRAVRDAMERVVSFDGKTTYGEIFVDNVENLTRIKVGRVTWTASNAEEVI